jgi:hypothetical protein
MKAALLINDELPVALAARRQWTDIRLRDEFAGEI